MEISETACKIIYSLCEIGEKLTETEDGVSDKKWTKEIKNSLARLGKENEYKVSGSGSQETDWSEWLFDLAWLEYDKDGYENATLLSVPLAMESEWKKSWWEIKGDFEKLLVCDASICLMIFQAVNGEKLKWLMRELQKRIKGYDASREKTYILAGWNLKERKFEIESCKVVVLDGLSCRSVSCMPMK